MAAPPVDQAVFVSFIKNMIGIGALAGSTVVSIYFGWKVFTQRLGLGQGSFTEGLTTALERLREELSNNIEKQTSEFKVDIRELETRLSARISELVNRVNIIDSRIDSALRRGTR